MKKLTVFLTTILAVVTLDCYAQRSPSLAFLKGQEKLHVVLDFSDVLLQGEVEKFYLDKVSEEWVEAWETAKSTTFKDRLLEHLNKNVKSLQCGDYPEAEYQATIRVLTIQRKGMGKNLEGPGTREITCEVVFTRTGDSESLAKVNIKSDSQANTTFAPSVVRDVSAVVGAAGSNAHLTGRAFDYVGQDLGKIITRRTR